MNIQFVAHSPVSASTTQWPAVWTTEYPLRLSVATAPEQIQAPPPISK